MVKMSLVEALAKANRRVIFVNISGNPVAMPWHDRVAAIVQGWYGGSESGEALADVLTGDVCPSGKLPFTCFRKVAGCRRARLEDLSRNMARRP